MTKLLTYIKGRLIWLIDKIIFSEEESDISIESPTMDSMGDLMRFLGEVNLMIILGYLPFGLVFFIDYMK